MTTEATPAAPPKPSRRRQIPVPLPIAEPTTQVGDEPQAPPSETTSSQPPMAPEPPSRRQEEELPFHNSSLCKHDVVQILSKTGRNFGMLMVVGDVVRGRAHGYCLMEGGKKEYVTVDEKDCWFIGKSKIRSQNPCSPKWIADNRA